MLSVWTWNPFDRRCSGLLCRKRCYFFSRENDRICCWFDYFRFWAPISVLYSSISNRNNKTSIIVFQSHSSCTFCFGDERFHGGHCLTRAYINLHRREWIRRAPRPFISRWIDELDGPDRPTNQPTQLESSGRWCTRSVGNLTFRAFRVRRHASMFTWRLTVYIASLSLSLSLSPTLVSSANNKYWYYANLAVGRDGVLILWTRTPVPAVIFRTQQKHTAALCIRRGRTLPCLLSHVCHAFAVCAYSYARVFHAYVPFDQSNAHDFVANIAMNRFIWRWCVWHTLHNAKVSSVPAPHPVAARRALVRWLCAGE